jgi:hypothetical protein
MKGGLSRDWWSDTRDLPMYKGVFKRNDLVFVQGEGGNTTVCLSLEVPSFTGHVNCNIRELKRLVREKGGQLSKNVPCHQPLREHLAAEYAHLLAKSEPQLEGCPQKVTWHVLRSTTTDKNRLGRTS